MNLSSKIIVIFIFIFTYSCVSDEEIRSENEDRIELVDEYIDRAYLKTRDDNERIKDAEKALYWLDDLKDNVDKSERLKRITKVYLNLEDSVRFFRSMNKMINLTTSISDSSNLAFTYNRFAFYYNGKNKLDSAYTYYNKAEKIYAKLNDDYAYDHGKSLLGMAIIQRKLKDYTESTSSTFEAIKRFKIAPDSDNYLSICYSNLGIVFNNLENYDKAIEYHQKSIDIARNLPNRDLREILAYNNMGIVYVNKREYTTATENYKKALGYKEYLKNSPRRYSLLLDNLAYAKFLSGEREGIKELFDKSLRIRDSIDDKFGLSINTLHLATYYHTLGNDSLARIYVEQARDISKQIKYNPNLLESYKLLSKISDSDEGLGYANSYIKLNDSLVHEERIFRDKFARIKYETDQIEAKSIQVSRENEILVIAVLGLTALFLLVYIIFRQQQSNKELMFAQQQQETNQEIYRLLLNQQVKLEEGRQLEQQRMSEELHDGVLGRLFGVRLSLDGINQRANDGFTEARNKYIEELKSIEKEIRLISHDLGTETLSPEVAYIDAVESLISDLCEAHQMEFEFHNDENIDWETIDDQKKVNLFRILQESLQNIFKHAKAKKIKISFDYVDDNINLLILDDGIGFKSTKVKRGIGLKNITSRVSQMSGVVDFISNKDAGTTVSVSVPL